MTAARARHALLLMFLGCLAIHAIVIAASSADIWPEDLQSAIVEIISIYAVPLAIILGGMFAQSRRKGRASTQLCWIALILSACWNLLLLWRTIAFGLAKEDSISDLATYLKTVSSAASFLIAGALAFFFGKTAQGE